MSLGHLRLREVLVSDSPIYFKWINDRETVLYNSNYSPVSEESHNNWFNKAPNNPFARFFSIIVVEENSTETLIGSCSLRSIDFIARSSELQIRIGEVSYRGRGYGTSAIECLLNFGFLDLNLNRIYLNVYSSNERAVKSYRKAGFLEEGVKREAAYINGEYVDVIMMAMLRNEYFQRN